MESSEFIKSKKNYRTNPILIGRGGTSELYRVMIHNKFHVLKKLKEEYKNSPQHILSLEREFEIGFQLDHPNVVRFIEYNPEIGSQSILMEYIDGVTLKVAIVNHSLSLDEDEKKKVVLNLCDVVEYLHSKQTYHLDLKPENILITFRGKNLKLIDFGHSLSDGHLELVGGTKEYMNPCKKENQFDATNDIYAIGKIVEFLYSNESEKNKNYWKEIIDNCTNNNFLSIAELKKEVNTINQRPKNKPWLYSVYALTILIVLFSMYQLIDSNGSTVIDKSSETSNFNSAIVSERESMVEESLVENVITSNTEKVEASKTKFNVVDSAYCNKLGSELFNSFASQYESSNKSIKAGSKIQSSVTDSIQSEWFKYSSKFKVGSIFHKQAYDIYFEKFTESQKKIMELLYGAE